MNPLHCCRLPDLLDWRFFPILSRRSAGDRLGAVEVARARRSARFVGVLASLIVLTHSGYEVSTQNIREDLYITDGPVHATVVSANTLYLGEYFTQVGPATGGGVPVEAISGLPTGGFPRVTGTVLAVVSDGAGGWYIGGEFTKVGGMRRSGAAHVRSDNVVSAWDPDPNGPVLTLAVHGSTVYAGGKFRLLSEFRVITGRSAPTGCEAVSSAGRS
jgi:hypothetical protein